MFSVNAVLAYLTLFSSVSLAVLVLFKNIKNKKNISFFIMSTSITLWMFFSVLSDVVKDYNLVLIFARLAMVGAPLFFGFLLYFILIFPREEKKVSLLVKVLIFFPVVIMELFVPTKHNIVSVTINSWGTEYEPGYLFVALFVMIVVYSLIGLVILFKKYRRSQGIIKERIKYFILSMVVSVIIGSLTNTVLPLLGYSKASVWGPLVAIIFLNTTFAYTIVKYRLMDIRIVVQKGIVYSVSLVLLLTFYFSLILFFEKIFRLTTETAPLLSAAISMVVGSYSIPWLISYFKKITSEIFFREHYKYSEVASEVNEIINKKMYLDEMLDNSFDAISKALNVDKIVFLLYDEKEKIFKSRKKTAKLSKINFDLNKNNPIFKYLFDSKKILISEELELKIDDNIYSQKRAFLAKRAVKKLREWSVYLCQPVVKKGELAAIICFGEKLSKRPFVEKDLELIKFFSNQVVISLENFLVYEEIRQRKAELEKTNKALVGREIKMMELKREIRELKSNSLIT